MKELLFTIKSGLVFRQLDCDGDEVWLFFARDSTANPEFVLELLYAAVRAARLFRVG